MTNIIQMFDDSQALSPQQHKVFSDALRIGKNDGLPQCNSAVLARILIDEVADIRPTLNEPQYATFIGVISMLMDQAMDNITGAVQ